MTKPSFNTSGVSILIGDFFDKPAETLRPNILVSDEVLVIVNWILYGVLLTAISSFGIASNIINIICFLRQGLTDPVNVSLLGLAISDLACLTTSLCVGISYNPAFETWFLTWPVDLVEVVYITFSSPHFLFSGLTSWITALITLERCLCITMPVKVKNIITPKRVTAIILCIFLLFTCTVSPMYFVSTLSWIFSPERNRTILTRTFKDGKATVEQFSYAVNNGLIPFSAYFTIIICTCTLVWKLRKKAKWRKTCVSSTSVDTISRRDQRVARMVMAISVVFIVCFTPMCVSSMSVVAFPELAIDGPNRNVIFVYAGISIVFESANSSANIFIYYHMSSRYKFVLRDLFRCRNSHFKK